MSPESLDYLGTAERTLAEAEWLLANERTTVAAREAYLASLNAARAVIFEMTGSAPKTHSGTRALLSKLVHEGLALDDKFVTFLGTAYDQKTDADYGPRTPLSVEAAKMAVDTAKAFIASAHRLLGR